jgi:hypothetical protein
LNDELTSHGQEVNLTNHIPYKELKDLSDEKFANKILKYLFEHTNERFQTFGCGDLVIQILHNLSVLVALSDQVSGWFSFLNGQFCEIQDIFNSDLWVLVL